MPLGDLHPVWAARRAAADADRDMQKYLGTLTPQDRAKYLADRQRVLNPPQEQPERPQGQQQPQQDNGEQQAMRFMLHAAAANPGHAPGRPPHPVSPEEQGLVLRGIVDDVSKAWSDENDSRVAQAREMRRMQHETNIESMRQEGLLKRLAAMQQGAYQPEGYAPDQSEVNNQGLRYNPNGGAMRVFNPNTLSWDYTDQIRAGGY